MKRLHPSGPDIEQPVGGKSEKGSVEGLVLRVDFVNDDWFSKITNG